MSSGNCTCKICARSKHFVSLISKMDSKEDAAFFTEMHNALLNNEFEVDLLQLKVEDLTNKLAEFRDI